MFTTIIKMMKAHIEKKGSFALRIIRVTLLVLIVIGLALLATQDKWVPVLVDMILAGN